MMRLVCVGLITFEERGRRARAVIQLRPRP